MIGAKRRGVVVSCRGWPPFSVTGPLARPGGRGGGAGRRWRPRPWGRLAALRGNDAGGLSATNISRLTNEWETEYRAFQKRSLADRDYVYVWVDGVHFSVRQGRSPLHARHDRCAARRDEGADYDRGRLPGERRELEDRAPRLEAPRQEPVYSASVESTSTPGLHGTSFKLTSSTPGSEQVVIMGRPLLRKTLIIGRFSASTKA